jgi:hypothetical protein
MVVGIHIDVQQGETPSCTLWGGQLAAAAIGMYLVGRSLDCWLLGCTNWGDFGQPVPGSVPKGETG